jgi:hypothetical protein
VVVLAALLVVTVVVSVVTVELVLEAVSGAVVLATVVGLDPPQPESPSTPSIDRTAKKTRMRGVSAAVG